MEQSNKDEALAHAVPTTVILNIEHPGIIKNVDNSIKSLGGSEQLNEFLNIDAPMHLKNMGVSLRPDDAFAKLIPARASNVNEVLLRVSVPRRTGRKRKRGSNEPFSQWDDATTKQHQGPASPEHLLRSMRDNVDRYNVEVLGQVRESHRFRSMPDSQYTTSTSSLIDTLRNSVVHLDQASIKSFRFGSDSGVLPGQDVGPPAHFTPRDTHDIPHVYSYKQHHNVVVTVDEDGNVTNTNTGKVKKHFNHTFAPNVEKIPDTIPPDADLEPEERLSKRVQRYIKQIRELMETRPIVTKRVINVTLSGGDTDARYAWAYCGYVFRSGPFRDALIKFGVDPRTDPKYRFYQCFTFKIDKNRFTEDGVKQKWQHCGPKGQAVDGRSSYEFDGRHVVTDGKVFQVCDITDPLIRGIIDTPIIRRKFSQADGWFHNGTVAKLRVVMKHKLDLCIAGKVPDDDFYQRLITFPDELKTGPAGTQHWREIVNTDGRGPPSKEEQLLSESIRTQASAARETRKTRTWQTTLGEDTGRTEGVQDDDDDDDDSDGEAGPELEPDADDDSEDAAESDKEDEADA